jgi:hypothetical protein
MINIFSRDGRAVSGSYGMTGPVSLPGPGANYMNIPPSSPRNKASAVAAAASMATEPMDSSNYPRYSSGEGYEGPRSLPFTLQQYEFQDGAMYQVKPFLVISTLFASLLVILSIIF